MSSSSSHTPCWGLVCKQWFSDLHLLPELDNRTYYYIFAFMNCSKLSWKKYIPNLFLPSPLQCWWAHLLHIPHVPQTQLYHGPFCKTEKHHHPLVKTNAHQVTDNHCLSELTFAGPLGFGWWFSPHQSHVVWADGTAFLFTYTTKWVKHFKLYRVKLGSMINEGTKCS